MPHFEAVTLNTPRLTPRPIVVIDADAVFAIFSHPEVMRYGDTIPAGQPFHVDVCDCR